MVKITLIFCLTTLSLFSQTTQDLKGSWVIQNPMRKTYFLYLNFDTDTTLTFKTNSYEKEVKTKYIIKGKNIFIGDFGYLMQYFNNRLYLSKLEDQQSQYI